MHMVICRILRYVVDKQYTFICWASFANLKYLAPFHFAGSVVRTETSSTLLQRNLQTAFSLRKYANDFRPHYAGGI